MSLTRQDAEFLAACVRAIQDTGRHEASHSAGYVAALAREFPEARPVDLPTPEHVKRGRFAQVFFSIGRKRAKQ